MKTPKQQAYHQKRCTYCGGSGQDTFNKEKPCPNCSADPVLVDKGGHDCKLSPDSGCAVCEDRYLDMCQQEHMERKAIANDIKYDQLKEENLIK